MKKILFICGSMNQTMIIYKISRYLDAYACYYTPYYSKGSIGAMVDAGLLDFTVMGGQARERTLAFLEGHGCPIDYKGTQHEYDLVVTCSDLLIQDNIRNKALVLVQEGMTDPENLKYHLVKNFKLPRYLANTSMAGLSHAYEKFCVASEGYRNLFIRKGVDPDRIEVTGIPNFDHVDILRDNDFPHQGYVLGATSHLRETLKYENRKKFIYKVLDVADGREIIFKLHPGENHRRAIREIKRYAPGALIFTGGNTDHMIANCDALVTKYSSVLLVALALGKPVYSDLDPDFMNSLTPIQNQGQSAETIAKICRKQLDESSL